jgi:hypothetical protein
VMMINLRELKKLVIRDIDALLSVRMLTFWKCLGEKTMETVIWRSKNK